MVKKVRANSHSNNTNTTNTNTTDMGIVTGSKVAEGAAASI